MYRIHMHTDHRKHMDLRFFSHTIPSERMCRDAHMLCVLSHTDMYTCRSECCPLSNPRRQRSSWAVIFMGSDPHGQRSSWAAILMGSDPRPLSHYRSLVVTFAPGSLRSLGDSCTCLLALSALLRTSSSLAVQVYSAIH